ncbi:hypothetical protein K1W69_21370 [Hoeflea sp. WL0058]|uniref:Uncharacterized protein n=1 Tax=Flavimaribacter sediminis TaxID=2865987 RepID=A0AAE3D3K4_9HYPH|nr:hypothetical protein [Flavimaribacter sediminis]MBW8639758.1 hypothetical protein [Flavimaribacter sediminis]
MIRILRRLFLVVGAIVAILAAGFLSVFFTIQILYINPVERLSETIDVVMDREEVISALDDFAEGRDDKSSGWFGYRFGYDKDGDDIYIGYSNGFDGSNLVIDFDGETGKVTSKRYFRD